MNKLYSIKFFSVIFIFALIPAAQAATIIPITTCQDLQDIGSPNKPLDGNYKLQNDIDCREMKINPIMGVFSGTFDGQNKHIKLQIDTGHPGMFEVVTGELKNLSIMDLNVYTTMTDKKPTGGLVHILRGGKIDHVRVAKGNIYGNAGLVGINEGGVISNCYFNGNVDQVDPYTSEAGGLVAWNNGGKIENSYFTGSVYSNFIAGGLVGRNSGEINNSFALGLLQVMDLKNKRVITTKLQAGGLVGSMEQGSNSTYLPSIRNSYAAVKMNAPVGARVPMEVGGLVGHVDAGFNNIMNSYWDVDRSGLMTTAGGAQIRGLSSEQMLDEANFIGWDFALDWDNCNAEEYPHLRLHTFVCPQALVSHSALQDNPVLSVYKGNTYVVWQDYRNGNWDIYYKQLPNGPETLATVSQADQINPVISGGKIVYEDLRAGDGKHDIYYYDLETKTEMAITTTGDNWFPAVSGDNVVWHTNHNGINQNINAYNFKTGKIRVIGSKNGIQVYPDISENMVVWKDMRNGFEDIYAYDLTEGAANPEKRLTTTTVAVRSAPKIHGDRVVWVERVGDYDQIFLYDLKTSALVRLTNDIHEIKNSLRIYEDRIVWDAGGFLRSYSIPPAVMNQPLKTQYPILTLHPTEGTHHPSVYGLQTVWVDERRGNKDIYYVSFPDTQAPTTPLNVFTTVIGQHSIDLRWSPSRDDSGEILYRLERKREGDGEFKMITDTSDTSYRDGQLIAGINYTYRITAFDRADNESTALLSDVKIPIISTKFSVGNSIFVTVNSNIYLSPSQASTVRGKANVGMTGLIKGGPAGSIDELWWFIKLDDVNQTLGWIQENKIELNSVELNKI